MCNVRLLFRRFSGPEERGGGNYFFFKNQKILKNEGKEKHKSQSKYLLSNYL